MDTNGNTKELLIKDLSSRLPYGVKVNGVFLNYNKDKGKILYEECVKELNYSHLSRYWTLKPYLFPLSSLTEEQRNNISKLLIDTQNEFSPYGEINMKGCDNLFICSVKQSNALINYCLTNHLDINGLIEEGLAIDATSLNIY